MNQTNGFIYFDNAASSWPKPPSVIEAVSRTLTECGANPGRGSHAMAVEASRVLFQTRKKLAKLFGVRNPNDIAYCLNTTHALNVAIQGFVGEGDHVVCTAIEHNSVRRPLEYLKRVKGVRVTYVKTSEKGELPASKVVEAMTERTKLVVVNHSSNLLGSIVPLAEIAVAVKQRGAKLLVDAAQTAGVLDIDVGAMGIDLLAFPGHKGLYGPQGTGGLYIAPDIELAPMIHGGTGSQSEAVEQPSVRPDRYEAGTQNTPGIAGLGAGVDFVLHETPAKIHTKEWALTQRMMEGLLSIPEIAILGPDVGEQRTGIVAFAIKQADPSEVAYILDQHYRIAVRSGFHCTPLAHEMAGTTATGAVRASAGYFNTDGEVDDFIRAIAEIADSYRLK
ncbi:aminotransferase class V-fold PLP-dependent enzyme [Paenibacillus thermotolerans]|uniref:aminotransferase class V-fold PLP-dependent enzyme n=1 Tax=Paenibacillus thermotolerans TaxID=3027807 RepID=UPI00236830E8|nr:MULTISPECIES: aminotransferase class V-fold PLP-dependent enzyme [unclassified Paenibacillus]